PYLMPWLQHSLGACLAANLRCRRAHAKLDGAWDNYHRLSLAVQVPIAALPVVVRGHQLLDLCPPLFLLALVDDPLSVGFLELMLLSPAAQQPLRRPMDAGVRIFAIQLECLPEQTVPVGRRKVVRSVFIH